MAGFPQKTADIRMAQYESGSRTPKEDLVKALAGVLRFRLWHSEFPTLTAISALYILSSPLKTCTV